MRIVMMGTGGFAEPTFQALLDSRHEIVGLVTQPDRYVGDVRGSTRQTGIGMKPIAEARGLPVFQPEKINTPEGVEGLRAMRPDLLVVAAYGQILSKEVLDVPPGGGVNVHASLLPKYRGAAPIAWAIYHGEPASGVTIIRMSTKLDAGNMLAQESIPIDPAETAGELELRLAALGARMALDVVDRLADGVDIPGLPQQRTLVTRAPKLTKEMGLIDWSRTPGQVSDQIRAMQPWPTAYTYLHRGQGGPPLRLIVWRARRVDLPDAAAGDDVSPGQVVIAAGDRILVRAAAGDRSVVEVLELQPEGKRRMSAVDFLRGRPLQPGDRFGPAAP